MRARLAGHPLHPAAVHFPLALWFSTVVWDVIGWCRPDSLWYQLAYGCLALGLILSLPAIATGFLEYAGIRNNPTAFNVATTHMMIMICATFIFGASFLLRTLKDAPSLLAMASSLVGALLLAVGGWLGGTLVYRYRIGVDK